MDKTELQEIYERIKPNIERFEGKTILISGGCGFLGRIFSHFFIHLNQYLKTPCKVIAMDNFIVGLPSIDLVDPNFTFINHDVCRPVGLRIDPKQQIDFTIAAHGIADPNVYSKLNRETLAGTTLGIDNLLEFCVQKSVESVILFSSSEIIGHAPEDLVPTPEMDMAYCYLKGERAAYDYSKALCIVYADIFHRLYGLNVKNVLPFNVYSSNMSLKDKRVIPSFISKIVNNQDIIVYGEGNETRTACHAVDFIYGCLLVLLNGKANEHYNIGNDTPEISMKDLAYLMAKMTLFPKEKIKFVPAPPVYAVQPQRRCPDLTKARKELGYEPKISLEEGLRRYLNYVFSNNLS